MSASLVAGGGDLTVPVPVVKEEDLDGGDTDFDDECFDVVVGGGDFELIIVIFVFLLFVVGVRG